MNRLPLLTLTGAASLLLVSATYAQSGGDAAAADAAPRGDARAGRVTYLHFGCYQCHGTSGQGGGKVGPKIAPDPLPFSFYLHQLRQPRAAMPVYTAVVLPDRDAANIYAYLMTISSPPNVADLPLLNGGGKKVPAKR